MQKNQEALVQKTPLYLILILVLSLGLIFSVLLAVTFGSSPIPFSDVYRVILNQLFGIGDDAVYGTGPLHDIIIYIRLPRLILAVAGGDGAGSVWCSHASHCQKPPCRSLYSGGVLRCILGSNSCHHAGHWLFSWQQLCRRNGCAGAFGISLLVMLVANIGSPSNSVKLLLAGMALSSVCSAFSSFVVFFAHDRDGMMSITYWLMGSLAGANWGNIAVILPLVILCVLFFITQYRVLNLMLLGDEVSITLGTDLHKYRNFYLLVTSLMIGFIVYASGMIGFVGLIVPHVVRILVGTDHKKLIPISCLMGAILLVWADVLCRVMIKGTELPIGILISMIGAPCFIYLMAKKSYGFGGKD